MERIVRIIEVRDTRQYEEQGDRWVPIPGSGNARDCARCGRQHEVHAEVELEGGKRAVVGTGCAGQESMEAGKRMGGLDRAAKRLAALERQRAVLQQALAAWDAAWAKVEALPLPRVDFDDYLSDMPYGSSTWVHMGDTKVRVFKSDGFTQERRDCLVRSWRRNRMAELGLPDERWRYASGLKYADEQISKVKARMQVAMSTLEAA